MNAAPLAPYFNFVRRHRWSYLAALLVSILGTAIYLLTTPTLYRAAARTIVPYREVESDLRFGNGRPFPVQYVFVVNNHLEVLRSGSVHRAILEAIKREDPELLQELRELARGRSKDEDEALLMALDDRLRASSRDKTGVLRLEATASTAASAARLANLALHTYATVQDSLNRSSTVEWLGNLRAEEAKWHKILEQRNDELQTFRSKQQVMDLVEEGRAVVREIIRLRAEASMNDAELSGQKGRLTEREAQLGKVYARLQESLRSDPASVADALRKQLSLDRARLQYLLAAGAAEDASQVQSLRQRIDRAAQVLQDEGEKLPKDPSLEGDPVKLAEKLLTAIHDFQPDILGRQAQVDRLDVAVDSLQARMVVIPALAAAEARYEREAKMAKETYELVQQRMVEAEMLAQKHDSRLQTIHPAEIPSRPSSPRRLLAMVGALFITVLLGSVAGMVVEGVDPTVRDADEAMRLSELAVLSRPAAEGGSVSPELAVVAAAQGLAGKPGVLWLVGVDGEDVSDLKTRVSGRLAALRSEVQVAGGSFEEFFSASSSSPTLVLLVARRGRTRRASLKDAARLLQGTGHPAGGLLVR